MSRKSLLKRKPRKVDFDGDEVWLRSPTLREALEFDDLSKTDSTRALRYLVAHCVVRDGGGEPEFSDENDPDILDIPADTLRLIGEKLTKQASSGSVASAEKN